MTQLKMLDTEEIRDIKDLKTWEFWSKYKLQAVDSIPDNMRKLHIAIMQAETDKLFTKDKAILDTEYLEQFGFDLFKIINKEKDEPSNIYKLQVKTVGGRFIVSLRLEIYATYNFKNEYQLIHVETFYKIQKFLGLWEFGRKEISKTMREIFVLMNVYNHTPTKRFNVIKLDEPTTKKQVKKITVKDTKTVSDDRLDKLEKKLDKFSTSVTSVLEKLADKLA